MKTTILFLLIVLSGCVHVDDWTREDSQQQFLVTTLFAVDAIQTTKIQHRPDLQEGGFAKHFLGSQPSSSETYQYFATVVLSHYLISRSLPERWRRHWQNGTIAIQAPIVISNCDHGLLC